MSHYRSHLFYVVAFPCLMIAPLPLATAQLRDAPKPRVESPNKLPEDALPKGAITRLGTLRFWHGGPIRCVAFSPDGKYVASGGSYPMEEVKTTVAKDKVDQESSNRRVCLWDVETGRKIKEIIVPGNNVYCIAITPDNTMMAVGCGSLVSVWSLASGEELYRIREHTEKISFVAFADGGKTLLSGACTEGSVLFSEAISGKRLRNVDAWGGKRPPKDKSDKDVEDATCLSFFPKSNTLLFSVRKMQMLGEGEPINFRSYIRVVDVTSGKQLCEVKGPADHAQQVATAHDGNRFATHYVEGVIQVWDATTGEIIKKITELPNKLNQIALSPDGKMLATGDRDSRITLWDLQSGKQLHTATLEWLQGFQSGAELTPLEFSPDGKKLVAGVESRIRVWDVRTGQESPALPGNGGEIYGLRYAVDGKTLLTRSFGRVCCWDTVAWKEIAHADRWSSIATNAHNEEVVDLSFDGAKTLSTIEDSMELRIRDAATHQILCRTQPIGTTVHQVFFMPNKNAFLVFYHDGKTGLVSRLHDATTGKELQSVGNTFASDPVLSPTGSILSWIDRETHLYLLDLQSNKEIQVFKNEFTSSKHLPMLSGSKAISPDDRLIALLDTSLDHKDLGNFVGSSIRICEIASGIVLTRIKIKETGNPNGQITSIAYSMDQRLLAVALRGSPDIHLYEILSGKMRRLIKGHQDVVSSLAFSPDGRFLASGSNDTTTLIWDMHNLPGSRPSKETSLTDLWEDLGDGDAPHAGDAIDALRRMPEQSVSFLNQKLKPVTALPPGLVERLIKDLDDDEYKKRENASRELAALGKKIDRPLRQALKAEESLEAHRRLLDLVSLLDKYVMPQSLVRELRAIEVLERIGTADAQSLLKTLAQGESEERLTKEAKESLRRLQKTQK